MLPPPDTIPHRQMAKPGLGLSVHHKETAPGRAPRGVAVEGGGPLAKGQRLHPVGMQGPMKTKA